MYRTWNPAQVMKDSPLFFFFYHFMLCLYMDAFLKKKLYINELDHLLSNFWTYNLNRIATEIAFVKYEYFYNCSLNSFVV